MKNFADEVNHYLKKYFESRSSSISVYSRKLLESMEYSLNNGGKRFRPSLCLHVADTLSIPHEQVLPFAAALEMIHTYSLIHDDLPCMDNDDERRGQPTNHIRYGQPLALLAGDGLLTEAFTIISEKYSSSPVQGLSLVKALSRAAGCSGMVGGQAMDMGFGKELNNEDAVLLVHKGKTAALIAAAAEGAGIVGGLTPPQVQALHNIGNSLGVCFQIKDDILDNEDTPNSVLHYWGKEKAEECLLQLRQNTKSDFEVLPQSCQKLYDFFTYNQERSI